MAQLVFANLVAETATAAGTGAFALQGAVSTQYSSFSGKIQIGSYVVYTARQGALFEVGYGVLTSSTQLTRVGVYDSSAASGYVNSVTPGSPGFVTFDSAQTLTVYNDVPAQLFLALNTDGSLASPTPLRKAIIIDTNTQMKALATYADGESVFVTGFGDSSGVLPGLFRFNAGVSTAPDGVDTFRNNNSSTGLYQRQKLVIQGNFQGTATFDAATSGGGFTSKEFANPSTSNANDYFARIVDASASAWRWASRFNQSGVKNFLNLFSPGNAQDRIETTVPFVQASVTDSTGLKARSLAWLSGVSRLVLARVDASSSTTIADYREIPLTKGGYIVTAVKDIYDLKQIDPTSAGSGFADYDVAQTRGLNSASSDSGHTLSGSIAPVFWYWLSTSTLTEDLVNVVRPSVGSAASGNGRWIREVSDITAGGTFTSGVATPSVKNGVYFITAGTTAITNFLNGYEGQRIIIQRGSADITVTHNSSQIDLAGNNLTLTTANPRIELICQGGVWRAIGLTPLSAQQYLAPYSNSVNRTAASKFSDQISVLDFGADSTGAASSNAAITNAIAAGKAVYFPAGTYLITANLTLNVPIVMDGAAYFSINTGVTLTISDTITASHRQYIFRGAGSVAITGPQVVETSAMWFGMAVTASAAANTAALAVAIASGASRIFIPAGNYAVTQTGSTGIGVTMTGNCQIYGVPTETILTCASGTYNFIKITGSRCRLIGFNIDSTSKTSGYDIEIATGSSSTIIDTYIDDIISVGSIGFLTDSGSSNGIHYRTYIGGMAGLKCLNLRGTGINFSRAFAFIYVGRSFEPGLVVFDYTQTNANATAFIASGSSLPSTAGGYYVCATVLGTAQIGGTTNAQKGYTFDNLFELTLSGCSADTCGGKGISITNCHYVFMNGVEVGLCNDNALYLNNTTFVKMANCLLRGRGQGVGGTTGVDTFYIDGTGYRYLITGLDCDEATQHGMQHASASVQELLITGAFFRANGGYGVKTSTGGTVLIFGAFFNLNTSGSFSFGNSNYHYVLNSMFSDGNVYNNHSISTTASVTSSSF